MNRKRLMMLGAALGVALVTALIAHGFSSTAPITQADAAPRPQGSRVLVAARALPVGTILTADAVSFQAWPRDMVQGTYIVDGNADMKKLLGTVVRFAVPVGQPVTEGSLVAPGERGFLAAALAPGMRAITISVSAKAGVGGFVFPGDRVDLMLTQSVEGSQAMPLKATETIIENLRVLATDQSTETETENGKPVVKTFNTATLEVTPRIGEKIAVADTIGTLSLSLRSISDSASALDSAVARGSVKLPENATAADEQKLLRQAMDRPLEDSSSYVTGGDVSRFQRRSMPPMNGRPFSDTSQMAPPPAAGPAMPAAIRPFGPVVHVTRGHTVEAVSVHAGT